MAMTVEIALGSEAQVEALFSYPNTGHEDQSLAETVEHYLADSLTREGFSQSHAELVVQSQVCKLRLTLPTQDDAVAVEAVYARFFELGTLGLRKAAAFQQTGKWDRSWRFLLPLGIPMTKALSVEIMDFPPLSLIAKQDYLNSKTTGRWWELLGLNGVDPAARLRHSCICDIVPVAAPAGVGEVLDASGVYEGPFDDYSLGLLDLLTRGPGDAPLRPIMALGRPIRLWIKRLWKVDLRVGDTGELELPGGGACPAMAVNHPSFFFYAVRSAKGPGSEAKNLATGLAVMKQDIVAAAWQTALGADPSADPTKVLRACEAAWHNRNEELLEVVRKQGGLQGRLLAKASTAEVAAQAPSPEDLEALERQFYAEGAPVDVEGKASAEPPTDREDDGEH